MDTGEQAGVSFDYGKEESYSKYCISRIKTPPGPYSGSLHLPKGPASSLHSLYQKFVGRKER